MPSLVFDFKDIASRMKGELKAAPEPEPEHKYTVRTALPRANWRDLTPQPAVCSECHGCGKGPFGDRCSWCYGTGVEP